MANGRIDIHDPFSDHNGITSDNEYIQKSTSDSESPEDMVEFRMLMAYAKRRRPKQPTESSEQDPSTNGNTNGSPSLQTEEITAEKKKKKKKIWKRLPKVLACLKPQTKEEETYSSLVLQDEKKHDAMFRIAVAEEDDWGHVASLLTEISDEIPFAPPELEIDTRDDDVARVIGLLLRESGDRLYEQELKDTSIGAELLGNYSFFEQVILALLNRMGLSTNHETVGPTVSTKTQIAVTCEATTRLSVLDTLPMNRLLGHGARYLKTHYSSWAEQQGGYEQAFEDEDDEVQ